MIRWIYWKIRGIFDSKISIWKIGSGKKRWATRSIWDGQGIDVLDEFRVWRNAPPLSIFDNVPIIPKGKGGTIKVNRILRSLS